MRIKALIITIAAALLCAGAASAGNGQGKILFRFAGQLTATPANGGVPITVQGGNKAALRAMLGASVSQTLAYGANTEFLKWAAGKPTVVQAGDLAAGDYVTVNVRAPARLRPRCHRAAAGGHRRRSRHDDQPPRQAAVPVPRHAQLRRLLDRDGARHGR